MSQSLHLHDLFFRLLNLVNDIFDHLWLIRDFFEIDTVRHFKLNCLIHRLFYILVVAESLPLSVNWMHRTTWKNTPLNELTPVNWILGSFLWIFSDNIINLYDFSDSKFRPAEWNLLASFNYFISHNIFASIKYFLASYRIHYPFEANYKSFAELVHYLSIGLISVLINCTFG